jgi:predicted dehydrogenase
VRVAVVGPGRMGAYRAKWLSFQRRFDPGWPAAGAMRERGALGVLYSIGIASHDHDPSPSEYVPTSGGIPRPPRS